MRLDFHQATNDQKWSLERTCSNYRLCPAFDTRVEELDIWIIHSIYIIGSVARSLDLLGFVYKDELCLYGYDHLDRRWH